MLLLTLLACLPGPVEYHMPDDTVLLTLIRAEIRVDDELVRKWDDSQVQGGVHVLLRDKLASRGKHKLFMDVPEDTPGNILPVLLGTAQQAGYTEVKLAQTGAPAVIGPLALTGDAPSGSSCVRTEWIGAMKDVDPYGQPFKVAFIIQKDGFQPIPDVVVSPCPAGSQ